MTLKVFGVEIKVKKVKNYSATTGDMAAYYYSKKEILIEDSLKGDEFSSTLLHELFHAVFHRILHQAKIPQAVEEIIVEALSVAVTENFTLKLKNK